MPKEVANGSSFGFIKDELELLNGSLGVKWDELLKGSLTVKGVEFLKGSFDREELEFLKGSESKPVPLFKNEKTS